MMMLIMTVWHNVMQSQSLTQLAAMLPRFLESSASKKNQFSRGISLDSMTPNRALTGLHHQAASFFTSLLHDAPPSVPYEQSLKANQVCLACLDCFLGY
jgi:hypothetical protein